MGDRPHRGERLDPLTSLRFVAAAAVVAEHSSNFVDLPPLWTYGGAGVAFFFTLSGFILIHVYPELTTRADLARFFIARLARLWPLHLFALALVFMLLANRSHGISELVANLLLVHGWVPLRSYFFGYNSVTWSLSTEMAFYLAFPLLAFRLHATWRYKLAAALLAAALLSGLCAVAKLPLTGEGVNLTGVLYVNPLGRLTDFVVGMCAGLLWHRIRPTIGSSRWLWSVAEVGAVIGFFSYMRVVIDPLTLSLHSPSDGLIAWWAFEGLAVASALLISVMASGSGLLGRALSARLPVFLGEISFAVYMLHQILLRAHAEHAEAFSVIPRQFQYAAFWLVLIALSAATYLWIETPARHWMVAAGGRWLARTSDLPDVRIEVEAT